MTTQNSDTQNTVNEAPVKGVGTGELVSPSTCYYSTGQISETKAHTLRVGRLELCCAWLKGAMPTWFYAKARGKMHRNATTFTLRAYRMMIGYRWYLGANTQGSAAREARSL